MVEFVTAWSKTTGEALPFQVPKSHLTHPVLGGDLTTTKPGDKKKPAKRVSGDTTKQERR